MKDISSPVKFILYLAQQSIRRKGRIAWYVCEVCQTMFPANDGECPKCHVKVDHSPRKKEIAAVPIWASLLVIVLGIISWATVGLHGQVALTEVSRALIYLPLGNLFGVSLMARS